MSSKHYKIVSVFVFSLLISSICEAGDSFILQSEIETKYIIFDTDMGCDDAWALQMVLKAEKELNNVKLLAITTVDGNTDTENIIKNTYRVLDGLNRTDIKIYKGASEGIVPLKSCKNYFWGRNGFGNIEFWKPNYTRDINSIIQKKNAVEIIRELIMTHPKEITLLCLGPLTNIALAIKSFPEIRENIKEIFIMGGDIKGRGNVVPTAEFNFFCDPESVYVVLNSLISKLTILPLDVDEHLNIPLDWRFNSLGKVNQTNVELFNEIEMFVYRNSQYFKSFDSLATAAFLFPASVIEVMNQYNVTMELQGSQTRGQTIVNHLSKDSNANIIEKISESVYKKIMMWAVTYD